MKLVFALMFMAVGLAAVLAVLPWIFLGIEKFFKWFEVTYDRYCGWVMGR